MKPSLPKALFFAGLVCSLPSVASAYIDPGTGSYLLQLLIAAFVAVSFTMKIFWKRISKFVSTKIFKKNRSVDEG
jgi:hypothetical protein